MPRLLHRFISFLSASTRRGRGRIRQPTSSASAGCWWQKLPANEPFAGCSKPHQGTPYGTGELARAAHRATDEERRRIAHDLHDGVVQDLAGISYELLSVANRLEQADPAEIERALSRGAVVSRESAAALRTLLVDLYSSDRRESLGAGLEALAQVLRQRGVRVAVHADVETEPDSTAEELLYRAAREALRNVTQHAAATDVTVELRVDEDGSTLVVADNGRGMMTVDLDERRAAGRVGLALLAERAHARGGRLVISSEPGTGTRITLKLPAAEPNRAA